MFGLVLLLVICGFVGAWIYRIDGFIALIVPVLIFICLFFPFIAATGGIVPDYSVGTRDGYITKISRKGVVWKTYEGELQVGTGNMAALQEPFEFSVIDVNILPLLEEASNDAHRVRLNYTQYIVPDWRHASAHYVVNGVEVLDEED